MAELKDLKAGVIVKVVSNPYAADDPRFFEFAKFVGKRGRVLEIDPNDKHLTVWVRGRTIRFFSAIPWFNHKNIEIINPKKESETSVKRKEKQKESKKPEVKNGSKEKSGQEETRETRKQGDAKGKRKQT